MRRVAYNEAFWVITGTAAPVVALATVLAAGDAGASARFFRRLVASSSGPRLRAAQASLNDAQLNLGLGFISLADQTLLLFNALLRVYYRSGPDWVFAWGAAFLEAYSLAVLVVLTLATGRAQESRSSLEGSPQGRANAPVHRPKAGAPARRVRPSWQHQRRAPDRKPSGSSSASGK
jgi:hypothetical protein